MSCSIKKRTKIYQKFRLDIWGIYTIYNNELSSRKKLDRVLLYWYEIKMLARRYRWFKKKRYVYSLYNRERFKFPKRLKKEYVKPRYLRNFYIFIKKRNFVKYVDMAKKGKLLRGFMSTFINFLEGRLFMIVYRLNIISNIFLIKKVVKAGVFFFNKKRKKHMDALIKVGDVLTIDYRWKEIFKLDMLLRIEQGILTKNILNFYSNYIEMFFIFYRPFKYSEISYPIRIDIYRAMDFIGPLR